MENIIVGAGISGSVVANLIAQKLNEKVLIIDKKNHIAGNIYDYKDEQTSITVHKYGPHIFHTNKKEVFDYLSKFTKWHYFFLKPKAMIEGKKVSLPFNLNSLYEAFSSNLAKKLEEKLIEKYGYGARVPILDLLKENDKDLEFISNFVFENVFKNYTMKQWGLKPQEIDPKVTARVPFLVSFDNRYFQDKYQAIPLYGYTNLIKNILNHKNIEIKLNTDFCEFKKQNPSLIQNAKRIIYTGAIDEYFEYKFGELPYRSLEFELRRLDKEFYQETVVVNYPNNYDFTRITEHKHFLDEKSSKTIISIEYPKTFKLGQNERYYPISNKENQDLYEKYLNEAKKVQNLYFLGRLGDYKYYNMDLALERAMEFFKELKK